MLTKVLFIFAALYAQIEYTKAYKTPPSDSGDHRYNDNEGRYGSHLGDLRYDGPATVPHVLPDGHIADTYEVSVARAEHLAAVAGVRSHSGYYDGNGYSGTSQGHAQHTTYHGPSAIPRVLHDGYIADTHEVAAAKADHLAAVAYARSHSGYSQEDGYSRTHHGHSQHTTVPHVLYDGHIADTHEVAAAKADHLSAVAEVRSRSGYHHGDGYSGTHHGHAQLSSYHGPTAVPHVLPDGHIADTHEVSVAKAEHLSAVAKARSRSGYHHGDGYSGTYHGHAHQASYHGPTAITHVLPDGHIADTHEVAVAKTEHLSAVANAQSRSGYHHGDGYSGTHQGYAQHASYHGPTAVPHVLPDGHIADTHEVAVAKAEHLAAVANAQSRNEYHHEDGYSGTHQEYAQHASYHEPTAVPNVLPDGHIADTHEVAVAKAEHLAAVAEVRSRSGYHHGNGYSGTHQGYAHHAFYPRPTAMPRVAAAKLQHRNDLNAVSHNAYNHYNNRNHYH